MGRIHAKGDIRTSSSRFSLSRYAFLPHLPFRFPYLNLPLCVLVTLFWGANDSCEAPSPQHVPIDEFVSNLSAMIDYIRQHAGEKVAIVVMTPPVFVSSKWIDWCKRNNKPDIMHTTKSNDTVQKYRDAALKVHSCFSFFPHCESIVLNYFPFCCCCLVPV
jgi:hypothetical protein